MCKWRMHNYRWKSYRNKLRYSEAPLASKGIPCGSSSRKDLLTTTESNCLNSSKLSRDAEDWEENINSKRLWGKCYHHSQKKINKKSIKWANSFGRQSVVKEIHTVEPTVSDHPKCKDLVFPYENWSTWALLIIRRGIKLQYVFRVVTYRSSHTLSSVVHSVNKEVNA